MLLTGVLGVTACAMFVHKPPDPYMHLEAPREIAGPVKVEISAGLESLASICELRVTAPGAQGPNLIPEGKSMPGYKAAKISLAPGRYRFEATLCTSNEHAGRVVDVHGEMVVDFTYRERILSSTADGLPHTWITFSSPLCVAHPEQCASAESLGGGESSGGEEGPGEQAPEAPSGPSCLADGEHTGDYSKCCSNHWVTDNNSHYMCCTAYKNCGPGQ